MAVVMRARRRHRHHERWREGFRRERGRNERCSGATVVAEAARRSE